MKKFPDSVQLMCEAGWILRWSFLGMVGGLQYLWPLPEDVGNNFQIVTTKNFFQKFPVDPREGVGIGS